MPKGGSALDTIQSNGHTLNTFNVIDSHTSSGVFTNSLVSHHNNRRQQYNRFHSKRGHSYEGQQNARYMNNRARFNNGSARSMNGSSFGRRPSGAFYQGKSQINVGQGYRLPASRGYYQNNQQGRGFYRSTQQGQRKYGPPKDDRSRSPNPQPSRVPERYNYSKGRQDKILPRSRSNSKGRSRVACLGCNQFTHLASKCPIYKGYCDTNSRRCNLLHPTKDCKQTESKVHTGEPILDEVVEPELLEVEQEDVVEFVPDAGMEQDQEMFQETEGYEE